LQVFRTSELSCIARFFILLLDTIQGYFVMIKSILRDYFAPLSKASVPSLSNGDLATSIFVARYLSTRSRASRARVGCVIWDTSLRTIVSIGYNGTAPGADNTMEIDNVTLPSVIHAEINALSKLSWVQRYKRSLVLVCTHLPCISCASAITKTKISHVYYLDNYGSLDGLRYLRSFPHMKITRVIPQ